MVAIRVKLSTPVQEMLAQRIYGLALGDEAVNDHEEVPKIRFRHSGRTGINDRYKKIAYWKEGWTNCW